MSKNNKQQQDPPNPSSRPRRASSSITRKPGTLGSIFDASLDANLTSTAANGGVGSGSGNGSGLGLGNGDHEVGVKIEDFDQIQVAGAKTGGTKLFKVSKSAAARTKDEAAKAKEEMMLREAEEQKQRLKDERRNRQKDRKGPSGGRRNDVIGKFANIVGAGPSNGPAGSAYIVPTRQSRMTEMESRDLGLGGGVKTQRMEGELDEGTGIEIDDDEDYEYQRDLDSGIWDPEAPFILDRVFKVTTGIPKKMQLLDTSADVDMLGSAKDEKSSFRSVKNESETAMDIDMDEEARLRELYGELADLRIESPSHPLLFFQLPLDLPQPMLPPSIDSCTPTGATTTSSTRNATPTSETGSLRVKSELGDGHRSNANSSRPTSATETDYSNLNANKKFKTEWQKEPFEYTKESENGNTGTLSASASGSTPTAGVSGVGSDEPLVDGQIGWVTFHPSGEVEMMIGNKKFEVSPATPLPCLQQIAYMDITNTDTPQCVILDTLGTLDPPKTPGSITDSKDGIMILNQHIRSRRFVVSPTLEELIGGTGSSA